jgi:hypothetical protein
MQLVVQASDKPYNCALERPETNTRHTHILYLLSFYQSMHVKSQHINKTLGFTDP